MKKVVVLVCIIALIQLSCQSNEKIFDDAICIENINTIDAVNGFKENQTVIIKDGKIFKIASADELQLSNKNEIIDGSGKFLIPGLWDAHVHFAYIEELAPSMFDLFLSYGITSVRDTGGRMDFVKKWKDSSLANPTKAPRVMIAGPLLDGTPNVYDGSDARHPPLSVGLNSEEIVTQQVNQLDSLGVDLLKVYEMLSPEQFKMITKLGKEKGLKVTGHVPLSMDVISASNAGLNSMEHMRNLDLSCASNADELFTQRKQLLEEGKGDPGGVLRSRIHKAQQEIAIQNYDEDKANEVLIVLAKNQTWQIPTLALNTFFTGRYFERSEWKESYSYLPDSIKQAWTNRSEVLAKMKPSPFRTKYDDWNTKMVGKIHQADIEIMAGTDTPIAYLTPGRSLHEELAVLVKAGLSPIDALKTATLNPAKYFNLENELGAVSEGMWADLVILDANPLDDINNTTKINTVIKHGERYTRDN